MNTKSKIRLLMLEDSPEDAELVRIELDKTGVEFIITVTDNLDDFSKALDEFNPEVILSDYLLPNFSGLSGLGIAKEKLPDVPYIFVSGHIGEDRAIEALKKGATDYVLKDRLGKLVPTIKRVLKEVEELNNRKIAEEYLKESEESYKVLFENNLAGVFNATLEGEVIKCNTACMEMLGYDSIEELIKIPLRNHFRDINESSDVISSVREKKSVKNLELHLKKKNGDTIWVLANIGLVHDHLSSAQICMQGTMFDVTQRKIAVEEIIKAKEKAEEADKLKSEFLAQVSHEIRTPLNVILSYHLLLKDELDEVQAEEKNYIFRAIELAGRRLIRTVDLILNMSALQNNKMDVISKNLNLYNVLKNLYSEFKPFAESKNLILNLINNVAEPVITSDSYIIEQIFQNLIENAIKYTEEGEVEIIIFRNLEEKISVEIKDTGIGISSKYLERIFEPFSQEDSGYTRKYEGLGLGLALVKKYLDLLGNQIKIVSEKSKGTSFIITFN